MTSHQNIKISEKIMISKYQEDVKQPRACELCLNKHAVWYCASDDAFLCHVCDESVHSANHVATKHERVCLRTNEISNDVRGGTTLTSVWHSGFRRKARTPRSRYEKKPQQKIDDERRREDPRVPEIGGEVMFFIPEANDDDMTSLVPEFEGFTEMGFFLSNHNGTEETTKQFNFEEEADTMEDLYYNGEEEDKTDGAEACPGRVSSLLSRSFMSSSRSIFSLRGMNRGAQRYSNLAAAVENTITPPVKVEHTQLLIGGRFVDAVSGKTFPTLDPRNGEVIAQVSEGDAEDVNRAVAAARKAFDEGPWPKMTAYERSKILFRFADLIEKHNDEIAALETWDNGKPYEQSAQIEVPMLARVFRYYAGWADKIHGMTMPGDGPHHVQTLHEPIGVAGQIIPWNFPLLMLSWKLGPALACGNTVVLKTAEQTPLSALLVGKLLHEAGLPDGVVNIVSGFGATAGAAIASHMDVDKVAFTGSTDVGKIILELASKSNLKAVTLELGGKSPFIVCEDADVDQAVELAHFALFFNQGQCCCAGSRTFVHERVYDEFVEKAKARALKRNVGDPFKSGIEQGPQVDSEQFNKILKYIKHGVEAGATLQAGGDRLGSKGYYIQPTVFSDVKDDMLIATDEIFGPVQTILKFKDLDEVIARANNSRYGLAAGVFTQNLDTAHRLMRALRVGTVWINCFDVLDASIPFGGYKMSGIGREKGIYSLNNYLQVKAVVTSLKNPAWL